MQSIGQRIKEFRLKSGISQSELAELIGKTAKNKTTISNWERDRTEPSQEDIRNLASALKITIKQLLVGEEIQIESNNNNNVHLVPLLPATATGGILDMYEQIPNDILTETFPVYYPQGEKPKPTHFVSPIRGRSMEPTLHDGSKVLLEEISLDKVKYADPGIYALLFDAHFAIKEIRENEIVTANYLKLYSQNPPDTTPIIVEADKIRRVWKVIAIVYQRL